MTKTTGTIMGLALVLTIPTASAIPAPACPEVESARAMLAKAAAAQNDRELQARTQDAPTPRDQSRDAQAPKARQDQEAQAPREQDAQTPRGGDTSAGKQDTVPPQMKRAALLVKEADTACQAGNTAEATEKAKAAIVLMQQ